MAYVTGSETRKDEKCARKKTQREKAQTAKVFGSPVGRGSGSANSGAALNIYG